MLLSAIEKTFTNFVQMILEALSLKKKVPHQPQKIFHKNSNIKWIKDSFFC